MIIERDVKLDFDDVLLVPRNSSLHSRNKVNLCAEYTTLHSQKQISLVPIMAANMDTVGTFEMAVQLSVTNMFTCIHKHYSHQQWFDFCNSVNIFTSKSYAVSTGISEQDYRKLRGVLDTFIEIQYVCIDVANGYTSHFTDFVKRVRQEYPDKVIIAGNVVTPDRTVELIEAGADIVKIGIGSGSACITRIKTGVGYPQLSAVIECSRVARDMNALIISDGGCNSSGDIAKALAAGANFVMLGGMLAGHDECIVKSDSHHSDSIPFYGMSSETAMNKYNGGVEDYRASEGRTVKVPYRGSVINTVKDILGGLRSTCAYLGVRNLQDISRNAKFIMVNRQYNDRFEK